MHRRTAAHLTVACLPHPRRLAGLLACLLVGLGTSQALANELTLTTDWAFGGTIAYGRVRVTNGATVTIGRAGDGPVGPEIHGLTVEDGATVEFLSGVVGHYGCYIEAGSTLTVRGGHWHGGLPVNAYTSGTVNIHGGSFGWPMPGDGRTGGAWLIRLNSPEAEINVYGTDFDWHPDMEVWASALGCRLEGGSEFSLVIWNYDDDGNPIPLVGTLQGDHFHIQPVPEPATLALLAIGALVLRRRGRTSSAAAG